MGVSGMETDAQKTFNFEYNFCLVSCGYMNVFFNNRCGDREDSSHGVMYDTIYPTTVLPLRTSGLAIYIYIT